VVLSANLRQRVTEYAEKLLVSRDDRSINTELDDGLRLADRCGFRGILFLDRPFFEEKN
jgi:hypothetical protein